MIAKISRYAILLIIVASLSIILPELYWMLFNKPIYKPTVYYSTVLDDFIYTQYTDKNNKIYSDLKDNTYDRKTFETMVPFSFYYDLEKWGILPESVKGLQITPKFIRYNSQVLRITPRDLNTPLISLNPLIESQSDFARLEMPGELFRIDQKIEFITALDNSVNDSMSEIYNQALIDQGFCFPVKIIAGNPTTRKSFDEGYFIVDAQNSVFHLKKVKGQPRCIKTDIPSNLNIRTLIIREHSRKEFYGLIVTWTDEVYMITYDNYSILKLPTEGYHADDMALLLSINPLHKLISYSDSREMKCVLLDNDYKVVNRYHSSWTPKEEWISSKVAAILFPFDIETQSRNSDYKYLKVNFNGITSLIGILIALLATFFCKRFVYRDELTNNWFDFVIVAVSGIFGAIAVLFIRPEPWD
ncbi:DUF4857 domain-containing protein [bacterium]|nr:DUF4857 domain-containing protein [bacterium]MBU1063473.1 DUF4857 domain-containing protein [bacterium]MBU1633035.1 DUF4857 domain-containing protein [bacterium]MBU1873089.1 DUF4857 domain-containing protein [bacterium]